MSAETRFYVSLPADKYGNPQRGRAAVIEARVKDGIMIPAAPAWFAENWPDGWRTDLYKSGWAEVDGPARMLSDEEYDALIAAGAQDGTKTTETPGEHR